MYDIPSFGTRAKKSRETCEPTRVTRHDTSYRLKHTNSAIDSRHRMNAAWTSDHCLYLTCAKSTCSVSGFVGCRAPRRPAPGRQAGRLRSLLRLSHQQIWLHVDLHCAARPRDGLAPSLCTMCEPTYLQIVRVKVCLICNLEPVAPSDFLLRASIIRILVAKT